MGVKNGRSDLAKRPKAIHHSLYKQVVADVATTASVVHLTYLCCISTFNNDGTDDSRWYLLRVYVKIY